MLCVLPFVRPAAEVGEVMTNVHGTVIVKALLEAEQLLFAASLILTE